MQAIIIRMAKYPVRIKTIIKTIIKTNILSNSKGSVRTLLYGGLRISGVLSER